MASYNRIILVGNLTRDPDHKQLSSGQSLCRLGLATNRQFRNKQTGEMIQEVCFVDVDVWGAQAESCREYLQKGRSVLVEGRLKLDMWQDNDGQRRSKHSIVADKVTFLGSPSTDFPSDSASETTAPYDEGDHTSKSGSMVHEMKKRKHEVPQTEAGEVALGDEEPFKDDLPF